MADALTFENLWKNHPTVASKGKPCDLEQITNFCAINLGQALTSCGVDTYKIVQKKEHCWGKDHVGHILRAEVFAKGLQKNPFKGLGKLQKISPEDFNLSLAGKTGIIFFKDYWMRSGESYQNRSGDHIDLWNGSKTTSAGWFRLNILPSVNFGPWQYSDLENSRAIWFWNLA